MYTTYVCPYPYVQNPDDVNLRCSNRGELLHFPLVSCGAVYVNTWKENEMSTHMESCQM